MGFDTFEDETKVINQAQANLENAEIGDFKPHYQDLLTAYQDLTKISRRLVRMSDRSEEALRDANEELKIARDAAEAAKEETKEFIAMISHELRTPLAVLQSEVELISEGIRQPNEENLQSLQDEVSHFTRLINDMFELSLTDIHALNCVKEESDLLEILRISLQQFEPMFAEKSIQLNFNPNDIDQISANVDQQRIKQVFTNILKNSRNYTDAGGQIQVSVVKTASEAIISFADSAPGLDEKGLQKLFNRFFRGESSRNRATGGAGLGMAICKGIMEAHQGRIDADQSELGGVLIQLRFPL